jgi:putative flippase GtrA
MSASTAEKLDLFWQLIRYVINSVVATVVHYTVLRIGLESLHLSSAGLANFLGAIVGISVSFAGSRYFVFRRVQASVLHQATKFVALYAAIACMHAVLLFVWTDLWRLDYTTGFLIGTVIQVTGSFFGNRFLVFNR